MSAEYEVTKTLTLSTAHLPQSFGGDFGEYRSTDNDYGWVVWLLEDRPENLPEWLVPIVDIADSLECTILNFDADGPVYSDLTEYEWN